MGQISLATCARGREVKNMSHLAIFEYQWEQKSFLDWPHSSKCSGIQVGIEEICYVWIHPREFNHPEPSPSPLKALVAEPLTLYHAGSDICCVPLGQWHLVIDKPSCHRITEVQPLMGLQRALRTQRSFMSDQTDKTASQVEKEEGGTEEERTGNAAKKGNLAKKVTWGKDL